MSLTSDMKKLCRELRQQGWVVGRTKSSHIRLIPPEGGQIVIASSTPSDYHAIRNTRALCARVLKQSKLRHAISDAVSQQ